MAEESIRDQALRLVELVRAAPGVANADAIDAFRARSPVHDSAIQWAEDYLELLPRMQRRTFSRAEQRRIRLEAWWARLWEPQRLGQAAAVVSVAIVLGWGGLHLLSLDEVPPIAVSLPEPVAEAFASGRRHREIPLDDGSVLWLDWHSSATVELSAADRRVTLEAGRVAFEVTPDAERPFIVIAGGLTTQVTGTEFVVDRRHADAVEVMVLEGSVAVVANGDELSLRAAELARLSNSTLSLETDVAVSDLDAWRDGRLVLRDATLTEAFAALKPYSLYRIDTAQLEGFSARISGTYFLDRADDAILGLIQTHELAVEQHDWELILSPPKPSRPTFR